MMYRVCIERVLSAVITITFGQKKTCTQESNKATNKDFPSLSGGIRDFLIGPHIFSACLTGPVCRDLFGTAVAGIDGRCAVGQSMKVWFIDDRFPAHFRHGHKRKPVKCCFPAW
jgi:hypothetical protein